MATNRNKRRIKEEIEVSKAPWNYPLLTNGAEPRNKICNFANAVKENKLEKNILCNCPYCKKSDKEYKEKIIEVLNE